MYSLKFDISISGASSKKVFLLILFFKLIFISLIYFDLKLLTLFLFISAAISDFLDGYLARLFNVESKIGEILDPIADKILLVSTLLTIVMFLESIFIGLMSLFLISREFWVSALRIGTSSSNNKLSVTFLAKLKTATQFLALSTYFISIQQKFAMGLLIADFILFLSLILSLKTALDYTRTFYIQLDHPGNAN